MTKKKKIGIVTYWESNDNYGQQLQCWALQYYLRKKGYNAFLIRQYFWPTTQKRGVKRSKQFIKDVIASILYLTKLAYLPHVYNCFLFCLDKEACRRRFPLFRKKYLSMTKIYRTPEALIKNPPKADVYITGSDHVWAYEKPELSINNCFLQFGESSTKRISYAPCIGHSAFPDELKPKIKQYLKSFDAISVRESSAVSIINELGYNAVNVIDPTMLLNAADYFQLAKNVQGKKSLFIYSMNYASKEDLPFEEIKVYANEHNLPIIVTPGSGYLSAKELFEGVKYSYATIPQWIQNIANAELVVTASFHGVVLSILLHRPFIYTPLEGKYQQGNARILDLLPKVGLEKWIWNRKNTNIFDMLTDNVNWLQVDERLNMMRKNAESFLLTAIDKNNDI